MIKNATQVLKKFQTHQTELERSQDLGASGITFPVKDLKRDLDELVAFLQKAEGLELLALIRHHDWNYMMADDPKAFRRGEESSKYMRRRFKDAVDQEVAKTIWKRHAGEREFPS
jgi:uncharacterized membrane-anchored protein